MKYLEVTDAPAPVLLVVQPASPVINVTHHRVYLTITDYDQQGVQAQ